MINKLKIISILIPIFLIGIIFIQPILRPGLMVGSDWTFPYSNAQMRHYGQTWNRLWNNQEIPTGTQIPHKNLYLFELLVNEMSLLGMDGVLFQKIFTVLILLLIFSSGFFLFFKYTKSLTASSVGATLYLFSPIVFNYFNMGWIFVLLFMGLMPIFSLLWVNFLEKKSMGSLILLSVLFAIAFFQSQSIFWLPLLALIITIAYLPFVGWKRASSSLMIGGASMLIMITVVHGSWLFPVSLYSEKYVTSETSNFDVDRFSQVNSLPNQLLGWGSLYNEHFEMSFDQSLKIFAYTPILLLLFLTIFNRSIKQSRDNPAVIMCILLVLVSPIVYIFRHPLASLPLSNIIRDNSRFLIFTNLGFALVVSVFWTRTKKILLKLCLLLSVGILISPYLLGRLVEPKQYVIGAKDQRVRNLVLPIKQNEDSLAKYLGEKKIFFPTGGSILSNHDWRFTSYFSWITDFDSLFSPFGSGIYVSDKSNPIINNFATEFFELSRNNTTGFMRMAQILGVSHIFVRHGLISTFPQSSNFDWSASWCESIPNAESDWSVDKVCEITDPYPLFLAENETVVESSSDYYKGFAKQVKQKHRIVSINCDSEPEICPAVLSTPTTPPKIEFSKLDEEKYLLKVSDIKSEYILVLNQTMHPGWELEDINGEKLSNNKYLINQMVNGWLIPYNGNSSSEYIVEFYPNKIFKSLVPYSLLGLGLALIGGMYLCFIENKNSNCQQYADFQNKPK